MKVVTPLGWSAAALVVVGVTLGVWLGWLEMWAVAGFAAGVLAVGALFLVGRTSFAVSVDLVDERVTVGDAAVGAVIVANAGSRPSPSVDIELPVGRGRASFRVPRLAAGGEHDEVFTIPTHRRAVVSVGPVRSVQGDPLGLLRRTVDWSAATELFVHPKVVRVPTDAAGFIRDLEGLPSTDLADDDVSFHALREYVPGDDLRNVHWLSTARTRALMIRRFEQTRRSEVLVLLSTHADDYAGDDEFELAVSIAGSIGLAALSADRSVALHTSAGSVAAPTPRRLLDALSAVGRSSDGGLDAVAAAAARSAPTASVVVLVSGSAQGASRLRGAARRGPRGARALAFTAAVDGELRRRVVGDLPLVTVPDLASLARAARAVAA